VRHSLSLRRKAVATHFMKIAARPRSLLDDAGCARLVRVTIRQSYDETISVFLEELRQSASRRATPASVGVTCLIRPHEGMTSCRALLELCSPTSSDGRRCQLDPRIARLSQPNAGLLVAATSKRYFGGAATVAMPEEIIGSDGSRDRLSLRPLGRCLRDLRAGGLPVRPDPSLRQRDDDTLLRTSNALPGREAIPPALGLQDRDTPNCSQLHKRTLPSNSTTPRPCQRPSRRARRGAA